MNDKCSVLVVGAGPTGLMTACQLALRGIDFRIIDKSIEATTESRALVLHARTLEIFAQMGIAEQAISLGEPCRGVTWMFNGKEAASMAINGGDLTPFPYILCLEQSKTEELLIHYLANLGHSIERGTELIDYSEHEDKNPKANTNPPISGTLKKQDGSKETFLTDYIIGADGAHSIIREKIGMHLDGETYPQILYVIDCQVDAPIRPNEIYLMATKTGLTGFFPMVQSHTGNHRYRVLGVLPSTYNESDITFEAIQKEFAERIEMPTAKIHDPAWISIYHTHHRHAKAFKKGRCFIVGDAAHIHSPVGGQGMNTGLQDAYNLAWKLALVIQGYAGNALLETYNSERIIVAQNLVKTTDKVFYMAAGEKPLIKNFRLNVLPWILRGVNFLMRHVTKISREVFRVMSQIGIQYPESALSRQPTIGHFSENSPKPGDRFPYVFFQENHKKINIQNALKGTGFHAFIFLKSRNESSLDKNAKQQIMQTLQSALKNSLIAQSLNSVVPEKTEKNLSDILTLHFMDYTSDTEPVYKAFGIEQNAYYLVRPDMYIACRSALLGL